VTARAQSKLVTRHLSTPQKQQRTLVRFMLDDDDFQEVIGDAEVEGGISVRDRRLGRLHTTSEHLATALIFNSHALHC
jgi:hypothetical protein